MKVILMNKYSTEDVIYNNELQIVESLFAFHPQYFSMIDSRQLDALSRYYLFNKPCPENIFAYRRNLVIHDRLIEQTARETLSKLMQISGMN
ncbi:hypothetical protein AXFE_09120 [Acidithrix ferrooxidans]|uniref:Uncharacterized protein n=2 Tax=Acidithrix ferrooxidans TaxID=1280514 RepID=A0A0D8HK80_9ACTN|nr:hypothetical protein AXFE_09120 [Acidithrix ferrooxidans]